MEDDDEEIEGDVSNFEGNVVYASQEQAADSSLISDIEDRM